MNEESHRDCDAWAEEWSWTPLETRDGWEAWLIQDGSFDNFSEFRSLSGDSLGDLRYKPFGVTPEPEVRTQVVPGDAVSSVILVSDGISEMLSDNEIADLARSQQRKGPEASAKEVLDFAEEMGSSDNCTVIVIPLPGWAARVKDTTKDLREYRRSGAAMNSRQRRM